jgi:hypothetical protein
MDRPIPIHQIYQPTILRQHNKIVDIAELIKSGRNGVIWGSPGSGKTILLHWIYIQLQQELEFTPVLFTLRWPGAVDELELFVADLARSGSRKKSQRIILLVDGYDELTLETRKLVSQHLRNFSALAIGSFYLTCRLYYEIVDLKAPHFDIGGFSRRDALSFVEAFLRIYGEVFQAHALIDELEGKGFADFLESPLLLTLICILKTGPLPSLPRNTIGVIRRAIDTLTLRWDESKGIAREGAIPVDGEERIRCLMQIAYHMEQPIGPESGAFYFTEQYLSKLQRGHIDPGVFLRETAQWYGLFVPASNAEWAFVHRTIHDFLAARHWVETGAYAKGPISRWNTRAAYAACLLPDATPYVETSLIRNRELHFLVECLGNNAPFDVSVIAKAVIQHLRRYRDYTYQKDGRIIRVGLITDFLHLVSDDFLAELVRAGTFEHTEIHDVLYLVSAAEWRARRKGPIIRVREDLQGWTFDVNRRFGHEKFRLMDLQ